MYSPLYLWKGGEMNLVWTRGILILSYTFVCRYGSKIAAFSPILTTSREIVYRTTDN